MKKLILIFPITLLSFMMNSCGKKETCVCTENRANSILAREAGMDIDPEVVSLTIGETGWDVAQQKMTKTTEQEVYKIKSKLESEGYTCEWE